MDSIIDLNVGGHRFTTSLQTLTKIPGSMLGSMFGGKFPLVKREDGSVFIDRGGSYILNNDLIFLSSNFHIILNYLRGNLHLESHELDLKDLLEECNYYGLTDLVESIKQTLSKKKLYTERKCDT